MATSASSPLKARIDAIPTNEGGAFPTLTSSHNAESAGALPAPFAADSTMGLEVDVYALLGMKRETQPEFAPL